MRDRGIADAIRAAKAAEQAVEVLREMLWSLLSADPSYSLIVHKGLRAAGAEAFQAATSLDAVVDTLADLQVIENSGVA